MTLKDRTPVLLPSSKLPDISVAEIAPLPRAFLPPRDAYRERVLVVKRTPHVMAGLSICEVIRDVAALDSSLRRSVHGTHARGLPFVSLHDLSTMIITTV